METIEMKKYGLIGFPLSHSFSPKYFAEKFEKENIEGCSYEAYPLQHILEVQKIIDDGVLGFNVTIPYKEDILDFLKETDDCATAIGAVNCVKNLDGILYGFNTDEYGFRTSLLDFIGQTFDGKALVLGTGGAAKAVFYVLNALKIPYLVISRKQDYITYEQLTPTMVQDHHLIINTTPLGMYPQVDEYPNLPYDVLSKNHYLYDLVYNPAETSFLRKGREMGAKTKNGADMLVLQAEKSWEIWNQK